MNFSDILSVIQWWTTIFFVGIIFIPITSLIFSSFFDKGYIFAKIIGIALISYAVFVLGFLKILPFTEITIILVSFVFLILNIVLISKYPNLLISLRGSWKILFFEEIIFLGVLFFWSFIHAHQPEIHGLEKYMDFGFINSMLRAKYFPPLDMWLTPFYINYYYFGHLATAVLTKLSTLPSSITYNLMLSTISAFTFTGVFSIVANLMNTFLATTETQKKHETQSFSVSKIFSVSMVAGFLSGMLVTFAGNLHTVYLFFKPYANENPVPFWNLIFSPQTFPNSYWYPNATRFIENTIHEFPIYSNVVSDLHGHFLDIPFVLLTIAVLLSLFLRSKFEIARPPATLPKQSNAKQADVAGEAKCRTVLGEVGRENWKLKIPLIGFLLAVMYMTNAWDGIIYLLLTAAVIFIIQLKSKNKKYILHTTYYILPILVGFFLFSLPFNLNFKPFASGIGILCAPKFLADLGKFGPFIFEPNHCQQSPIWQSLILYGFFYFWVVSFFVFLFRKTRMVQNAKLKIFNLKLLTNSDIFVLILIALSTLLIVIPEFVYVKDIYPAHYRANTMFKLVYQSFIMLSLASAYISVRLILNIKNQISKTQIKNKIFNFYYVYLLFAILFFILVFLYPYFAINSYFGNLKVYYGLNGTDYLKTIYPNDYEVISWINKTIKGQPVILEAQGDSYTDYARVSANTGLPTVLGWTVHEWLWRGTYDIPSPRIAEVTKMYESESLKETKTLLKKYNISLIFIGDLEKQKYPNLNVEKFKSLGKVLYQKGGTKIFEVNPR